MLFNLSIENVALIKKADINLNDGFSVLTGETGAGKSILIGSLNMLLGERAGKDIIRHGENYAYVEGLFYLGENARIQIKEFDIDCEEDGSLIISRRLLADGKNICKAGGRTVSVSTLRDIGRNLVNIHGQHDNQALLDSKCHILFLDAFCKKQNDNIFTEYENIYGELLKAKREYKSFDFDENEKLRKIDILQFEIEEIENAGITPGEEEELKSKKNIVKNKEDYMRKCANILSLLYEGEEVSAHNLIFQASRLIDKVSDENLSPLSEKVNELLYGVEEVAQELRVQLDKISFDESSIDEIEERLDIIYRLKRKYGQNEEEILKYLKNAKEELENITLFDERKAELEKNIEFLTKSADEKAKEISIIRKKNALIVEQEINSQLKDLNMSGAHFSVCFSECELSKTGADKVEFLISTNIGEAEKPLTKIISGGELSRIMLTMKNVLSEGDVCETLIFDEIDTGISGITAGRVGVKLSQISNKKQVICVTHLPQIAALSDNHFKIEKSSNEKETNTYIKNLSQNEKISEIAYMISGDVTSETSLMQAKEMIENKNKESK